VNTIADIIYPDCFRDDWQMHESERLALTAILHRTLPRCAVEIGTYRGGSLSLICQYARHVFSIDIDPDVASRYSSLANVSFLTGSSQQLLPLLLAELDANNMPLEFVLVDGDHSAEGVKRDVQILLAYEPKVPMFLALHDSFNPDCRSGMLLAGWETSPYVHWVDLDFIPGRMNEHGGGGDGEMWGGLALAYLRPEPRTGPLTVGTTSKRTFDIIRDHVVQRAATIPTAVVAQHVNRH
jgi:hypothetical protein